MAWALQRDHDLNARLNVRQPAVFVRDGPLAAPPAFDEPPAPTEPTRAGAEQRLERYRSAMADAQATFTDPPGSAGRAKLARAVETIARNPPDLFAIIRAALQQT